MIDHLFSSNGLQNDDLLSFKAELMLHDIKKGEPFVLPGQYSKHIALVDEGYLRTFHLDDAGNELTTDFNQPGTFCGSYYSFYTQQPSLECIQAITDCHLYLVSYNSLQKLYAKSFRVNVFGRSVLEKACVERDLRLKKILHLSAKEKYEWFLEKYPDVYKVAQLGHIASFLGMNAETLSRVRRSFIS